MRAVIAAGWIVFGLFRAAMAYAEARDGEPIQSRLDVLAALLSIIIAGFAVRGFAL